MLCITYIELETILQLNEPLFSKQESRRALQLGLGDSKQSGRRFSEHPGGAKVSQQHRLSLLRAVRGGDAQQGEALVKAVANPINSIKYFTIVNCDFVKAWPI